MCIETNKVDLTSSPRHFLESTIQHTNSQTKGKIGGQVSRSQTTPSNLHSLRLFHFLQNGFETSAAAGSGSSGDAQPLYLILGRQPQSIGGLRPVWPSFKRCTGGMSLENGLVVVLGTSCCAIGAKNERWGGDTKRLLFRRLGVGQRCELY